MIYNLLMGTLNPTHSLTDCLALTNADTANIMVYKNMSVTANLLVMILFKICLKVVRLEVIQPEIRFTLYSLN